MLPYITSIILSSYVLLFILMYDSCAYVERQPCRLFPYTYPVSVLLLWPIVVFHSFRFLMSLFCHACHMTRALLSISYSYTFVLALLTIYRLSHWTVIYESHFLSSCHRHLVQCSIHPSLIYIASLCGRSQPSASKCHDTFLSVTFSGAVAHSKFSSFGMVLTPIALHATVLQSVAFDIYIIFNNH